VRSSHQHQGRKRSTKLQCRTGCIGKRDRDLHPRRGGRICREFKVLSHPEDISRALNGVGARLERVGPEAGPLSQWLSEGLAKAGLPAICIETRHAKAFLKAQVDKIDRNDARGIAQMMRVNLYRPLHVKTVASQKHRALLRNFGLKVGTVDAGRFEARVKDLIEALPDLEEVFSVLPAARRKVREAFSQLHRKVMDIVRDDTVCLRLMSIPGVGPVTSLAFLSTIDIPARFRRSRAVGPCSSKGARTADRVHQRRAELRSCASWAMPGGARSGCFCRLARPPATSAQGRRSRRSCRPGRCSQTAATMPAGFAMP